MGMNFKSEKAEAETPSQTANKGRVLTLSLLLLLSILFLAWFDGGEEPLHPISHSIHVPEARQ